MRQIMKELDPLENSDLNRLQLFVYLVPVLGLFPGTLDAVSPSGVAGTTSRESLVSYFSFRLAAWLHFIISRGAGFGVLDATLIIYEYYADLWLLYSVCWVDGAFVAAQVTSFAGD
jgi:hypothetical protein